MRSQRKYSVCPAEVDAWTGSILQQALHLQAHGRICTVPVLLKVLLFAAACHATLHHACSRLRQAPCDQSVYNALNAWMPWMPELHRRLNRGLADRLPPALRKRKRLPLVIDLCDRPYYGQPQRYRWELCRRKRQRGTTRFHCLATLYLPLHGHRFTLALLYVRRDTSHVQVLRTLLEQVRSLGLWPRYLLLDRGFYSVAVIQYLRSVRCPFLLPVVHQGRRSDKPLDQLAGTRRFLAWKRSGWSRHVMQQHNRTDQVPVKICVCRVPQRGGGRKTLVFAYGGFTPQSPAWVAQEYRRRFGIESSYRQMNQARAWTTSRSPRLRLLLTGIGLILRNVWVWLHEQVLGRVRGRGVELHPERLRLRSMLLMLQHRAEDALGRAEDAQGPGPTRLPPAAGP